MKKFVLGLVAVAALGVEVASACSCMPYPAPKEALLRSSAVFFGTVTKVEVAESEHGFRQHKVTLDVERIWKGAKGSEAELYTAVHGASCGYAFRIGVKYLVYTSTDSEGRLRTSICQRTRPASKAAEDLAALGEGEPPTESIDAAALRRFAEDRSYAHDLFATKEACEEARKNFPFLNCQQRVSFGKDGRATVMVTDIMNIATYVIEGNKVTVTLTRPGEISGSLVFTLSADEKTLTLDENGTVWKRESR